MVVNPAIPISVGALLSALVAYGGSRLSDADFTQSLAEDAAVAIAEADGAPVRAEFTARVGLPTRHALLSGGENLNEDVRDRVAKAVAGVPGVAGVSWRDGTMMAEAGEAILSPLHCQEDVQGLLRARTIRFEESSSEITRSSAGLLNEVADALRPCLGARIAITGHTDKSGPEEINLLLSRERASAVRRALIARGIPGEAMQSQGLGSKNPVSGLQPEDPANRRIEFRVVSTARLVPTPIDTPGPR